MAYRLPIFNTVVNVWENFDGSIVIPPTTPADYNVLANCGIGRRVSIGASDFYWVLIPKGHVVYGVVSGAVGQPGPSWLEIPAASGRFYTAYSARNNALGFPNEHIAIAAYPVDVYPTT